MANGNAFAAALVNHIGQTVTIFTTSGGQSGRGFTGVLAFVNNCFVRLITQIGPAPGCALGNCCENHRGEVAPISNDCYDSNLGNAYGNGNNELAIAGNNNVNNNFDLNNLDFNNNNNVNEKRNNNNRNQLGGQGRASCHVNTLGAVVDIPLDKIASFVHNSVGGSW